VADSCCECFCLWFFKDRAAAVADIWQLDCGGVGEHGVAGCDQFATSGIATIGTSVTRAGPVPKPVSAASSRIAAATDSQRCFSAVSPPNAAVPPHLIAHRTDIFGFQRDRARATTNPGHIVPFTPMGCPRTERAGICVSCWSVSCTAANARESDAGGPAERAARLSVRRHRIDSRCWLPVAAVVAHCSIYAAAADSQRYFSTAAAKTQSSEL
jgi:hypothetical protein